MISFRAVGDGGKLAASVRLRGCFHHLAISDSGAAIVTESCQLSLPASQCRQRGGACLAPMVVAEENRKAAGSVARAGGGVDVDSSSELPQHRHYQAPQAPPVSWWTCVENKVPMVALECELPLSGRLSPPADVIMSAPFLPPVSSGGGGGGDGPGQCPVESSGPPPAASDRSGRKRKLSRRREDEEEEEGQVCVAGGKDVHGNGLHGEEDSGVTCSRCGEGCEGERRSEYKRRRLHEGAQECAETNEVESVLADEEVVMVDNVFAEEGSENAAAIEEQRVDLVVEKTVDLVVKAPGNGDVVAAAAEEAEEEFEESSDVAVEASGSFALEESEESVVDETDSVVQDTGSAEEQAGSVSVGEEANNLVVVDVVGESVQLGTGQATDDVCMQEFTVEVEPSGNDEASSEDGDDDAFCHRPPRISPFLNTPKQRKEERRKILKLSIHKMRAVEDPEHFLRRSVLINNTMKRLQKELREEKMRNNPRRGCYGLYRRASSLHYDVLNNSYLLHDEPFAISENDRITDDMTDALVTRLESTSSPVAPTPSPSPCPADPEPDTSSVEFPTSSSEASSLAPTSCSLEVTSSVAEPALTLTPDLTPAMSEPLSSMSGNLMQPASDSTSSESVAMSTPVPDLSPTSFSPFASSSSLSSSSSSSSSCFSSAPSSVIYEGVFGVPSVVREAQSSGSSCSSESQREKQLYADIDTVFNNLIHALGDS